MRSRSLLSSLLLAGLLLTLGGEPADAAPPPEQRTPAFAYDSHPEQRTFLIVWVEDRGSGPDIYAKRLFNNGLPQGGPSKQGVQVIRREFGPRAEVPGPRADPSLVYNPQTEEFLMTYSEYTGEVEGWNVYAVRISAAGFAIGKPREIVGGEGDQQRPDVDLVDLGNGNDQRRNYLVVYDDNTRDVDEVWSLQLRSNSIPVGRPSLIFRDAAFNASDPTTNGSSVAWVDDRNGQTDIWTMRLRNGNPQGEAYRLAGDGFADDYAPRYGDGGLVWNTYDAATGEDIVGVQVYANNRTRGGSIGILVPVADQAWPDNAQGITVYADNRSGRFNLYGIRTSNFRRQGREFPILIDQEP